MQYKVTVTQESTEALAHGCHQATLFKQNFKELDLAALVIFLNQSKESLSIVPSPGGPFTPRMSPDEAGDPYNMVSRQDEPSSQGMPETPGVDTGGTAEAGS